MKFNFTKFRHASKPKNIAYLAAVNAKEPHSFIGTTKCIQVYP